MADIASSIAAEGFAADNVAYGMGGGLLQKVIQLAGWLPGCQAAALSFGEVAESHLLVVGFCAVILVPLPC